MRLVKILLLVLLSGAPAYATVARLQSKPCEIPNASSLTCTFTTANLTTGSTIIMPLWAASNTSRLTFTITDNNGNSAKFKRYGYRLMTVTGSYRYAMLYIAKNVTGGASETITITPSSGGVYMVTDPIEYSGLPNTDLIIENKSMSNNPSASLTIMSAAVGTGNTDLAFSFAIRDYGSGSSWSQTSGWTTVDNFTSPSVTVPMIVSEQLNVGAGTYSNTYTNTAGTPGVDTTGMIFTFRTVAPTSGIYNIQSESSKTSGTSTSVTASFQNNVTAGSLLVASAGSDHAITSVSGCSATWVLACSASATATFGSIYYAVNASAGACTVTANSTSATNTPTLAIAEYNMPSTTALENCATIATGTNPSVSVTTTQASNLVVNAAVGSSVNYGASTTGFSLREAATGFPTGGVLGMYDKVTSGTGSVTNTVGTVSGNPIGIIAAFGAPAATVVSQPSVSVQ